MSAEQQRQALHDLAAQIAQKLSQKGEALVRANNERERGFAHDVALLAGMRLDRDVRVDAHGENLRLWIDETVTTELRIDSSTPPATGRRWSGRL